MSVQQIPGVINIREGEFWNDLMSDYIYGPAKSGCKICIDAIDEEPIADICEGVRLRITTLAFFKVKACVPAMQEFLPSTSTLEEP